MLYLWCILVFFRLVLWNAIILSVFVPNLLLLYFGFESVALELEIGEDLRIRGESKERGKGCEQLCFFRVGVVFCWFWLILIIDLYFLFVFLLLFWHKIGVGQWIDAAVLCTAYVLWVLLDRVIDIAEVVWTIFLYIFTFHCRVQVVQTKTYEAEAIQDQLLVALARLRRPKHQNVYVVQNILYLLLFLLLHKIVDVH